MSDNIQNAVVVITGASSGIGRATAFMLAEKRAAVVLSARQERALEEVAAECQRLGGRALVVPADVSHEDQVQTVARRAMEQFGRIDAWVNNAGVTLLARFEEAPPDGFRQVIETNFFGVVNGSRAALAAFRKQGHGVLVNIASELGKVGAPYATAYAASKFAVTGFTESLRMELRDDSTIRVSTILPSTMDTPLFHHAGNFTGKAVQAPPPVYVPEDVAAAVLDCISNPRREVYVGNARQMVSMRMLPGGERLVAAQVEKRHFQNKAAPSNPGNVFAPMTGFNAVHGGWGGRSQSTRAWTRIATLALVGGSALLACFCASRKGGGMVRHAIRKLPARRVIPLGIIAGLKMLHGTGRLLAKGAR